MMSMFRISSMAHHKYGFTTTINVMNWFGIRSKHIELIDYLDL
jgi:hypothetical protein